MDRNQILSAQFLDQARKCKLQDEAITKIEELVLACAQDGTLYHEQEGYELRVLPWREYNVVYTIHQLSGAILIVGLKPSGPMPPLNRHSESWVRALAKKLLLAGMIAELKELIKKFPDIDFMLLLATQAGHEQSGPAVVNQCLGEIDINDFIPGNDLQLNEFQLYEDATFGTINLNLNEGLSTHRADASKSLEVSGLSASQLEALTMAQLVSLDLSRNLHGLNRRGGEPTIGWWLKPADKNLLIDSIVNSPELDVLGSEQSSISMDPTEGSYGRLDLSQDAASTRRLTSDRVSISESYTGSNPLSARKTSHFVCDADGGVLPLSHSLAYLRNRLHCNEIGKSLSS